MRGIFGSDCEPEGGFSWGRGENPAGHSHGDHDQAVLLRRFASVVGADGYECFRGWIVFFQVGTVEENLRG